MRDLARQVPSSWQQELKAARTVTYERWLERLQEGERAGRGSHPWVQLDPPGRARALGRGRAAGADPRRHGARRPGAQPTLLLERYCRVLGVRSDDLAPGPGAGNTSLGRVQAELLRQVNLGLPDDLRRRQVYGDVGKRWFASEVLAAQEGAKILVPERLRPWCEEVADAQVAALAEAGYHVEGSLDDLRCRDSAFAADADADPSEAELSSAAVGRPGAGRRRSAPGRAGVARRRSARRSADSRPGCAEPSPVEVGPRGREPTSPRLCPTSTRGEGGPA